MNFIKKIYLTLFCRLFFANRLGKFGKNSYIREGRHIVGWHHIHIGSGVVIGKNCRIICFNEHKKTIYNPNFIIGNNTYIGEYLTVFCAGQVKIGENCLIASNVMIADENHGLDISLDYSENRLEVKSVTIGNGVWIGEKVCILPGVTIGNKSVVAAGSGVTINVPEYSIVAGNPARVIKKYDFELNKWVKVI